MYKGEKISKSKNTNKLCILTVKRMKTYPPEPDSLVLPWRRHMEGSAVPNPANIVPASSHCPRPNSWTKSRQKSLEFSSLLFTVSSTALPWDFLFLQNHTTSYDFYSSLSSVTVHCKGERKKTWSKTAPPSLWFKKSIQKPQVWELSRLSLL